MDSALLCDSLSQDRIAVVADSPARWVLALRQRWQIHRLTGYVNCFDIRFVGEYTDVLADVPPDQQQVGQVTGRNRADLALHLHGVGVVAGRRLDCLQRRHIEFFDKYFQLPIVPLTVGRD